MNHLKCLRLWALAVCFACTHVHAQFPTIGGSNFPYYSISNCNSEPYGVIYNYNTAQSQIDSALISMYSGGQQRLRIPIFYGQGTQFKTGTVMDLVGGVLGGAPGDPPFMANFSNLLASIRAKGFRELEIGFFPVDFPWINYTQQSWSQSAETYYQANWSLIRNLHPIIVSNTQGMTVRIDLMNEGLPPQGANPNWIEFCQRLWSDYTGTFGYGDTVGFSMVQDAARVAMFPTVYGTHFPYLYDVHLYEYAYPNDVYSSFVAMDSAMNAVGVTKGVAGWIVGEAYYNDAMTRDDLVRASNYTGRTIFYIAQWPLNRISTCPAGDPADVAPPVSFGNYTWPSQSCQPACQNTYNSCVSGCPPPGTPGNANQLCVQGCASAYDACINNCH